MRFLHIYIFLLLFFAHGILSAQQVYVIDSVPESGRIIKTTWQFQNGDNANYKEHSFDDSKWDTIDPSLDDPQEIKRFTGICWFRLHFKIDSSLNNIPLAFIISHTGASEIYFDGQKIGGFGTVSATDTKKEIREESQGLPVPFNYKPGEEHVLAIRYSNHSPEFGFSDNGIQMAGLQLAVVPTQAATLSMTYERLFSISVGLTLTSFYLVLGLVHLLIWFFYKTNKGNLYYFLFALNLAVFPFCISVASVVTDIITIHALKLVAFLAFPLIFVSLLNLVYYFFHEKFPKRFRWYLIGGIITCVWNFFRWPLHGLFFALFPVIATIDTLITVINAVRRKKRGSKIIGTGILLFAGFILFALLSVIIADVFSSSINIGATGWGLLILILFLLSLISIPVSMSVYLARDFAQTNVSLKQKLDEVETLSAKSIEQEKEKQRILETEKDRLEEQVAARTSEITEQKKVIEEKNKDITDSIHYAKKIQDAMLPASDIIKDLFPESFILFRPKDIVSGDFYWTAGQTNSELNTPNSTLLFIAAADCTGHGVPGALMSMTGNNFLNQLVNERNLSSTKEILTQLDEAIRKSLKQERSEAESRDGMDIALCRFSSDFSEVLFSGANRPLWILRNNEILEFKPDKKSIGGLHSESLYTEQKITLQKNDCLYFFTDGYADQFGGPKGKKFMTKQLKSMLLTFGNLPMNEQKAKLEEAFLNWKNELTQVDDVLVIGVQVK